MMKKIFTLWAACALPMVAPLSAHEGGEEITKIQKDRERLIDLVLNLEADFGKTLNDYNSLQNEYAALLSRPVVPDQSGKVKALQKQLEAAVAKLQARPKNQVDHHAHALLQKDLVNLRNELQRERQNLLVAKAQLLRVKQLEKKTESLEASLTKETSQRVTTMGELQAIRGERDALLGKIKVLLTRLEKSEKGHEAAKMRIAELEKEANNLKLKLQGQELALRKLQVEYAHRKGAMAAAVDLKKEQDRLNQLLATREKELTDLLSDLAVEMKRSLDIPVLIKGRDDLQKKLTASMSMADGLKKKNKVLTDKQVTLQKKIETVQKSISAMQSDLAENKKAMGKMAKLTETNATLLEEREALEKTIAMAKGELVKSRGVLRSTEAKLAESLKKAAQTDDLQETNTKLMAQLKIHKAEVVAAKADMGTMQKRIDKNQGAMKAAADLSQKVEVLTAERQLLNSKLEEAKSAHLEAEGQLKAAKISLIKNSEIANVAKKGMAEREALSQSLATSQTALKKAEAEAVKAASLRKNYEVLAASAIALEKQKSKLASQVRERDNDLRNLRAELAVMSKKPDRSADLKKLQGEKEELASDLVKRESDLKKTRGDLGRLQLSAAVAQKELTAMKRANAKIDNVRYAKGEADVSEQQTRILAQVQQVLKLFPEARFEIVGHTCDLGSAEGNLRLSQQRAKALQDFLVEEGVEAERLKSRGVGQAEPMLPNTSEASRRQNRRVVVEILD